VSGLYGGAHQAIRRALAPYVPGSRCWRCSLPILPGQPWDLGHDDDNPALYRGPEHARCSRQAGARKGNQRRRERRERTARMVTESALAWEISEDRRHTSVVAAGRLPGDLILLELVHYLAGTDPVAAVLELQDQRPVVVVAVDPHSPGATTIGPLEDAGVKVTTLTSSDLAVAHGLFLDTLAAGRIRHRGQSELTSGMRALEQRRLGGASAPERRGALVDVSPAVAGELATWGLLAAPRVPVPAIY
jgi:hypothetical protein